MKLKVLDVLALTAGLTLIASVSKYIFSTPDPPGSPRNMAYGNPYLRGLSRSERKKRLYRLQAPAPKVAQRSLLLELPDELRNEIHEHVLISHSVIRIHKFEYCWDKLAKVDDTGFKRISMHEICRKAPGLLQTCRSIRNEATAMYYSSNSFSCFDQGMLCQWLKGIERERRAMLKDVRSLPVALFSWRDIEFVSKVLGDMESYEDHLAENGLSLQQGALRFYLSEEQLHKARTKAQMKALDAEPTIPLPYGFHRDKRTGHIVLQGGVDAQLF